MSAHNIRGVETARLIQFVTLGFALALPGVAAAQEDCGDQTCDLGTTCVEGVTPQIAILCPADAPDCGSPSGDAEPYFYCQPSPCESDADCSEYMECVTYPTRDCPEETPSCEGIDDEEECTALWAAWEAECTEGEMKECGLRWHQECDEASDCGEGFECKTYTEQCACPAAPEGEETGAELDCLCEEEGATYGYCEATEQACEDDSDCLDHWTCGENWGLQVIDCPRDADCEATTADGPAKVCHPPEIGGGLISIAASSGVAELAASSDVVADDTAVVDEADDGSADAVQDLPTGTADPSAQSGAKDEPEVAEVAADSADDASESADDACSVATPAKPGSSLPLGLVGLGLAVGMVSRRRRMRG